MFGFTVKIEYGSFGEKFVAVCVPIPQENGFNKEVPVYRREIKRKFGRGGVGYVEPTDEEIDAIVRETLENFAYRLGRVLQ